MAFKIKKFGNIVGGAVGGLTGGLTGGLLGASLSKNTTRTDGTPMTQQEQTFSNLWDSLSNTEKKDLLINNPNIITPEGGQTYDPLTNTLKLMS